MQRLVVFIYPSEKWWSESQLMSVGMMTFPTEWKNKHVPNDQPVWFSLAILMIIIDHHWSISTCQYLDFLNPLLKRCTFRTHTNTFIGPGSILEYRTHYKPSFKCPFFPAFTTHAEIQYPLRQAMELVNWFVNAWFQPITCVAVKGSNPITNSSKQVVFISSRSLWTSNKPLQHRQILARPHCISIWIHYKYPLVI